MCWVCWGVTCSVVGVLGVLEWNEKCCAVSLVCWVCQGVTCTLTGVLGVSCSLTGVFDVLGCNMQSRWCVGCVRV